MRSAVVISAERDVQVGRLRALVGNGDADLSEQDRVDVDSLRIDIERLSGDVVRAEYIEQLAQRTSDRDDALGRRDDGDGRQPRVDRDDSRDAPVDPMPDYTAAKREFSVLRAVGRELGLRRDAGLEDEVMSEMRRADGVSYEGIPVPREVLALRATVTTASGTGGGLVPDDHRAQNFIEVLRSRLFLDGVGATLLDGLMGDVTVPGQSTASAAGWAAEGSALTQSDPVFMSKALSAKKVGMFTNLTREVIRQANPDVEMLVMADFAAGIGKALDQASLAASTSNGPSGVRGGTPLARSGTVTNGKGLTREDVLAMVTEVDSADAPDDSRRWLINTPTLGKLFTVPRGGTASPRFGSAQMIDEDSMRGSMTMYGDPVFRSNTVRSDLRKGTGTGLSEMFYANWSGLLVGFWGGLDLLANPFESAAYKAGTVLIRGMMFADLVIRNPDEFAFYQDVITTV